MKQMLHEQIAPLPFFLLCVVSSSLVLPVPFSSVSIILLLLSSLFFKRKQDISRNESLLLLLPVLLFLYLGLGYFYSSNSSEAWHYLERKLSFLALPLAFYLLPAPAARQWRQLLLLHFISLLAACVYCLFRACIRYTGSGDTEEFFYQQLAAALNMNAVYLSAYLLLALILLHRFSPLLAIPRQVWYACLVFFSLFILLLSSKMILALGLLYLVYVIIKTRAESALKKGAWLAALLLLLLATIWAIPFTRQRIQTELNSPLELLQQKQFRYDTPFTGYSLRWVLWRHSLDLIEEENAWVQGVGIGDFQDKLDQRYRESGMYVGNPQLRDRGYLGYNPHNQYVELLLAAGINGLILFTAWLLTGFWLALRARKESLGLLILLLAVFCLSESVLSTNKGIVWFLFFYGLLSRMPESLVQKRPRLTLV